jgi:SWI/SNF-related matrix-associated actin-dependent regulator 1 of chromatin subfamily A
MLMRKKSECLNLPPKIRQTVDVDTNLAKHVDVSILKKGSVDAIMEHLMKLKRMSAEAKIEAAIEFVTPLIESGQKVVIFSDHTSPIHKIHGHFGEQSVLLDGTTKQRDRDDNVQRFQNDPNCMVFCGNIKAAGVGITLTASSIVVFVDLTWLPSDVSQAEDRCHRIGTTGTVNVYYLTDPDLITDSIILKILGNRSGEIASFEGAKQTALAEVQAWVDRQA